MEEGKTLISQHQVRNLVYHVDIESTDAKGNVETRRSTDHTWSGVWKLAQSARQRGEKATIGHTWRIGR